ncbi:uncharacterized protein LOC105925998 isoform X1 [Fundulus heteroclitus]|uniref:uncharacterized protein LOC105925998 isoform X1 n=2 Tax=Fundulus heteroclitus TaxID=8078 RepID=UPI00165C7490|nr:uncharacterized protein LOC105925998 isoform X1 [Fundulus heteroclitus]
MLSEPEKVLLFMFSSIILQVSNHLRPSLVSIADCTMDSAVLTRAGCPAIYQKKTKKGNIGTLTRVSVGTKQLSKPNKTILLVGETGAGKSTLVNALFNYTMGVKWQDKIWYQIVEEGQQSPTSDVIKYEIFDSMNKALPYSLTVIDTPGYIDTDGLKHDVIINQRLFDLLRLEDGIREVHAVGVVMKATEKQMSDQLSYVFDSVMRLFGNDLYKNIVALITHSDGRTPKISLPAFRTSGTVPLHFIFNNRQNEARTEETSSDLEEAWRVTEKGMSQFTAFLQKISAQQLQVKVGFDSFIRLTASIQSLQEKIKVTELQQKEIKQIQEALKKHKEEMKRNKNFTVEVDEVYNDKEPLDGDKSFFKSAVCCTVCEQNCHYPGCTMALNPEQCEVMKMNSCTVCTRSCPASEHVKGNWRYVTKTRKVQRTKEEFKMRYLKRNSDTQKQVKFKETLVKKLEILNMEKERLIEKAYHNALKLDDTLLQVNSVSTYINLDFLIKKMKEKGDTGKVDNLEMIDGQMDGGAKSVIECKFDINSLQHIISNSFFISSGPPAVYQLKTRRKTIGTLTRVTFGQQKLNKPNKSILLVGETGAGKSTLINALVNHAMGVKFEDKVWFQIVEDEKRSQTESQTSDVIVYQIFGFEGKTLPFSLTIIDTPGYGDTRGIEHDVIVSERLFELFQSDNGIHEIDSVGLVLKSSVNRLSDRLRYIFDSVMSLFGKDIEKNIVALVTHSNGRRPKDLLQALDAANIKCAKDEKKKPVCFLFNNCQHEERTEEAEYLENADRIAAKGLSGFTDFLGTTAPQKLQTTLDVLNERIRLSACIQNLQERIRLSELKQTEIKQIKEALKNYEQKPERNKTFAVEVYEAYKDKEPIDGGIWLMILFKGAVCCTVCEENCHSSGCTSSRNIKDCKVMKDGRCTVCSSKCPVSAHIKGKWRYVTKTRKVQKNMEIIKRRSKTQKRLGILQNLECEIKALRAEKSDLLEEAFQHVVHLEKIALKVNSLSTFVHLDFLIEKMKDNGDTKKVQKLEEMKKKEDEGARSKLQHVWNKIEAAGKKVKEVLNSELSTF